MNLGWMRPVVLASIVGIATAPLPAAAGVAVPLTPALMKAAGAAATAAAAMWAATLALGDKEVSLPEMARGAAARLAADGTFFQSSLGPYQRLLDDVLQGAEEVNLSKERPLPKDAIFTLLPFILSCRPVHPQRRRRRCVWPPQHIPDLPRRPGR